MLYTPMATRGMVSAPHHLASQAGLAVLREGGNAIEAAVAAAAACGVVYPHTCGLGGDAFWYPPSVGTSYIQTLRTISDGGHGYGLTSASGNKSYQTLNGPAT